MQPRYTGALRMRWYIPLGKHLLGINFRMSLKKREGNDVIAISNKVDHRYCIFLDYDYTEETAIDKDIRGLQRKFSLGNAYVFKTLNGFHVMFIDLVEYDELLRILNASTCDEHYKYVSTKNNNRTWVLRITPKKNDNNVTFHKVIKHNQEKALSYPHSNYLMAQGVSQKYFYHVQPFFEAIEETLVFVRYRA